jgi:hypothetical protein
MKFTELGTKALRTIGAIGQGITASAYDITVAFEACQDMMDAFAAQRLTVFQTRREVTPIVANQGSIANPYTVGVGGDIDIFRPTWIAAANYQILDTTPALEGPLAIYTPQDWARVSLKNMTAELPQGLFYDGQFPTSGVDVGLGNLYLYPVPDGTMSLELVLYIPYPFTGFADIATTDYTFPPGYAEALRYQLAKRLATEYRKQLTQETQQLVVDTFAVLQRPNVPMPILQADWGVPGVGNAYGLYNWRTGTGGQ